MLDEGYWQALLRDVEMEAELPAHNEPEEFIAAGAEATFPAGHQQRSGTAGADSAADWERAEALLASGETTTVQVTGFNRGGLLVSFGELQGFIPASHLSKPVPGPSLAERALALAGRVGETLTVRVTEIDREHCKLILSERTAPHNGQAGALLANLRQGQVCQGLVTSLCPFGAFVDLGGFEGLIHISELSWGRVNSPAEVVKPGDRLSLLVLDVNPEAQKVALSLKRLHPDPWVGVETRYYPGQVVEASITNVVNFGAFARLEEGLEGLIHVSELAEGTFLHPRNVIHEGDRVRARVLYVDGQKRRIALTLRGGDGSHARLGRQELSHGKPEANQAASETYTR
ncbi:MAG: 30S ribosomal protein S1 [Anaerolineae bacterium]